jgi:hypothetical protein
MTILLHAMQNAAGQSACYRRHRFSETAQRVSLFHVVLSQKHQRCGGTCTSLSFLSHSVRHTPGPKSAIGTGRSTYWRSAHGNMDNTGLCPHLCHIVGLAVQSCEQAYRTGVEGKADRCLRRVGLGLFYRRQARKPVPIEPSHALCLRQRIEYGLCFKNLVVERLSIQIQGYLF